jgi:hypothetical protein
MKNPPMNFKNSVVPTVSDLIDHLKKFYNPGDAIAYTLWTEWDVRTRLSSMCIRADVKATDQQVADLLEVMHDCINENGDGDIMDSLISERILP